MTVRLCQEIRLDGSLAGAVIADAAVLAPWIRGERRRLVQLMCLFAMDVALGSRPGPYDDDRALAFAHAELRSIDRDGRRAEQL